VSRSRPRSPLSHFSPSAARSAVASATLCPSHACLSDPLLDCALVTKEGRKTGERETLPLAARPQLVNLVSVRELDLLAVCELFPSYSRRLVEVETFIRQKGARTMRSRMSSGPSWSKEASVRLQAAQFAA